MEILDLEEPIYSHKGRLLGIIGIICQAIGALSCAASLYLHHLATTVIYPEDSPEAILLKTGIGISAIGKLVILPIGIFFQRKAFSNYKFSPKWLWYVLLGCGLMVLVTNFKSNALFFILLGLAILQHIAVEKDAYLDEK